MVVKSVILVQIGDKRGRSDVIVSYIVKNNLWGISKENKT